MSTAENVKSATHRMVAVRLFAAARQRAGCETVTIQLPPNATIGEARNSLAEVVPALSDQVPFLLFAIGTEYAHDDDVIPEEGELAAFPPVSGG